MPSKTSCHGTGVAKLAASAQKRFNTVAPTAMSCPMPASRRPADQQQQQQHHNRATRKLEEALLQREGHCRDEHADSHLSAMQVLSSGTRRRHCDSFSERAWFQASSTAFSCCLIWSCLLLPVGRGAALLFPGSTLGMLSLMPA